jgi:hypothetical protein
MRYNKLNLKTLAHMLQPLQNMKDIAMKFFNHIAMRLVACALLCASVSACVSNASDAYYYNPSAGSHSIYGYNAVDFDALDVAY